MIRYKILLSCQLKFSREVKGRAANNQSETITFAWVFVYFPLSCRCEDSLGGTSQKLLFVRQTSHLECRTKHCSNWNSFCRFRRGKESAGNSHLRVVEIKKLNAKEDDQCTEDIHASEMLNLSCAKNIFSSNATTFTMIHVLYVMYRFAPIFKAVPSRILFSALFQMSSSCIVVRIRADAW